VRKTTPASSRSASAVEDAEFDEFYQDERPSRSRTRQSAGSGSAASSRQRLSRFDDFDSEQFDFPEEPIQRTASASRLQGQRRLPRDASRKAPTGWAWLFKTTAGRWALGCGLLLTLAVLGAGGWMVREFLRTDPRFRVASSDQIQVDGNAQVTRDDVRAIFGEDIGRNLFFIPIRARQQQLEALPWVDHASVQRLLPNHVRVRLTERVPVAFAQDGDGVKLIDKHGALLDTPSGPDAPQYSFPVLDGMGSDLPLSVRAARMGQYLAFVKEMDAHGEKVSSRFSEVDLSDPEDMLTVMAEGSRTMTVHFGDEKYFERYQLYQGHLAEWEQQYPRLAKVDLRNSPQVVLGMSEAAAVAPAASPVPASTPTAAVVPAKAAAPAKAKTVPARAKPVVAKKALATNKPSATVKTPSAWQAFHDEVPRGSGPALKSTASTMKAQPALKVPAKPTAAQQGGR
jgi:cell division protein FtsQ